ncbi:hypothetical protein PVAP13_3KG267500 [Panicum virgatum]|uniref:Uncharacterized protein n=1 Tax=Panicum virgatum TaxID=38727 RepID=A0A8T0V590_PANVG|nr:hypothetical protein PVAP13_3KG267500 [Panicum virgatum]
MGFFRCCPSSLSPTPPTPCCRADRGRRRPAGAGAPRPLRRRPAPPAAAPPPSLPCCSTLPDRPCCRAAALSPLLQRCRPPFPAAAPPSARPCCRAAALPCCCCAGPMPLWPAHLATGAGVEPGTRCSVVEPAATQPREEDWRRDKDDRVGKK